MGVELIGQHAKTAEERGTDALAEASFSVLEAYYLGRQLQRSRSNWLTGQLRARWNTRHFRAGDNRKVPLADRLKRFDPKNRLSHHPEEHRVLGELREHAKYKNEEGVDVHTFWDVPISDTHNIVVAVGNRKNGFVQVPLIQYAKYIVPDVMISGDINREGAETHAKDEPKRWREVLRDKFGEQAIRDFKQTYVAALIPKLYVGESVYLECQSTQSSGTSLYQMVTNGFVVGNGIFSSNGTRTPLMLPGKDKIEQYLSVGDMLSYGRVKKLEKCGVFPGVSVVAASFVEESAKQVYFKDTSSGYGDSSLLKGSGMPSMGFQLRSTGRAGVGIGEASDMSFKTGSGKVKNIEGMMMIDLQIVSPWTSVTGLRAALDKRLNL